MLEGIRNGEVVFHYLLDHEGKYHCDDGPAIVYPDGREIYYQHGLLHRLDGPAATYQSGMQEYYQNGRLHNEHGPAIIHKNGKVEYYINGELPFLVGNVIITRRDMVFRAEIVPTYWVGNLRAYRFDDPDELALAILYYS